MNRTGISYLDFTCNAGGCGCSMGCVECWVKAKVAARVGQNIGCDDCKNFRVHFHPERLEKLIRTKKPFVVGMDFTSDIFDPLRMFDEIDQRYAAMALCPQHTFIVLTKQAKRMREYIASEHRGDNSGARVMACLIALDICCEDIWKDPGSILGEDLIITDGNGFRDWPLPNVFHGLTVRTQKEMDPDFLKIPGNKWLSLEPLWGEVFIGPGCGVVRSNYDRWVPSHYPPLHRLSGVVVGHDNRRGVPGTETLDHIRSVVEQCRAAGVKVYVKQMWINGKLRTKSEDFPEDLRHRQLPWKLTTKLSDEKCREIAGEVMLIKGNLRQSHHRRCRHEIKACDKILEILGAKDGD